MNAPRTAASVEPIPGDGEWIYPSGWSNCSADPMADLLVDAGPGDKIVQTGTGDSAQIGIARRPPSTPHLILAQVGPRSIVRASGHLRRARSQLVGARRRPAHRRTSSDSSRGDPSDLADESEPARGGR